MSGPTARRILRDQPVGGLRHPRAVAQVADGDGLRQRGAGVPRPRLLAAGSARPVVLRGVAEAGQVGGGQLGARHPPAAAGAPAVAEHRREERVAGVVALRVGAVVRCVERDLEEVRRVRGLVGGEEVHRQVAGHRAGVRLVLGAVARARRWCVVLDQPHPAVDDRRAGEVPAVVGRSEDRVEGRPARHHRRQLAARRPLVLVEELADEPGRVARLLQPQVEGAPRVAVRGVGRPAPQRRLALVARVGEDAGLVGVLAREEARARDTAERVGDEGVRVGRTRAAHRLNRPHRLDEVHREVVEHHHDDVGPGVSTHRRSGSGRRRRGPPGSRADQKCRQAQAGPGPLSCSSEVLHVSPVDPPQLLLRDCTLPAQLSRSRTAAWSRS